MQGVEVEECSGLAASSIANEPPKEKVFLQDYSPVRNMKPRNTCLIDQHDQVSLKVCNSYKISSLITLAT
jgi:hypothetical protein